MSVVIVSEQSSFKRANVGPWVDTNDNVYGIFMNPVTDDLKAFKASDPLDSWVEQDNAGRPTTTTAWQHDTWQDGDEIHCIWWNDTDEEYQYHTFQTSDHASADQWGTVKETIEAPTNPPLASANYCAISVRSDGDIIVVYDGDTDNIMGTAFDRVDYAREEGAGWTVGINVAGQGVEADFHTAALVKGESDGMYITYFDGDADNLLMKFLTSGNTLESTIHTWITDIGTSFDSLRLSAPQMTWNEKTGSDEKIYMAWLDSSDNFESNYAFWNGSGFTSGTKRTIATNHRTTSAGTLPVLAADATTGEVFCVYVSSTNADIYFTRSIEGGLWKEPQLLLNTFTVTTLSCNITVRGIDKLIAVILSRSTAALYEENVVIRNRQNLFINQAVNRASTY